MVGRQRRCALRGPGSLTCAACEPRGTTPESYQAGRADDLRGRIPERAGKRRDPSGPAAAADSPPAPRRVRSHPPARRAPEPAVAISPLPVADAVDPRFAAALARVRRLPAPGQFTGGVRNGREP